MRIEFVFDIGTPEAEIFIVRFSEAEDLFDIIYTGYDIIQPFYPTCRMLSLRTVFD